MKNILKNSVVLFGYKLLFTLLAVGFFYSFANLTSFKIGLIIYSSITTLLYLMAVYSYIWKIGKDDSKQNKFNIFNALLPVFIAEILTYIITFVHIFNNSDIVTILYIVYQFIYIGFLSGTASKLIVFDFVFVASILAYILGYKKFEIYDKIIMKLVYKTKKKDC